VRNLAWGVAAAVAMALLCCGCSRKPEIDGRKIFLQSETELNKVRSFRAHIVTSDDGGTVTDAEFQCDKGIAHYSVTKENPASKTEFVATDTRLFHRPTDTLDADWTGEKRASNLRVCTRLLNNGQLGKMGVRFFSPDQERILPLFAYYAHEETATITPVGSEMVDGVSSEAWKVQDKALFIPLHTVWIGTVDRLPTKYVEGDVAKPKGTVTFSGYGEQFDIQLPRAAYFPKEAAPEMLRE
jgi:hypothetical protein